MKKESKKSAAKRSKAFGDERFAKMQSDPKFNFSLPRKEIKVSADVRFTAALSETRFQNKAKVDKYGRAIKHKNVVAAEMAEMYDLQPEVAERTSKKKTMKKKSKTPKPEQSEDEAVPQPAPERHDEGVPEEDDDDDDDAPIRLDLARGDVGILSSSSDEDDDDDDEAEPNEDEWQTEGHEVDEEWQQLDKDVRRVEWASPRLAICNLDWDNVSSEDLLVLCASFAPKTGVVKSLTILLSDFGKERLDEEERRGPRLGVKQEVKEEALDDDFVKKWEKSEKEDEKNNAIRQYELDRLRYYYAVLECDTEETAVAIYEACDGHEFENSGIRIDMRFIPNDMQFEAGRIKERVTQEQVNLEKYRPKEFVNKAACNSKAEITWDEANPNRTRQIKDTFSAEEQAMDEMARGLIASSSEDEEDAAEAKVPKDDRIRTLLEAAGISQGGKDFEVEWEPPEAHDDSEDEDEDEQEQEQHDHESDDEEEGSGTENTILLDDNKKRKKEKNTWNAYLERRREKRKERKRTIREEREAAKEARSQAVAVPRPKRAKPQKEVSDADVERVTADPRFASLLTDSAFAIEQSNKAYKGSKLLEKQVAARKARATKASLQKQADKAEHDDDGDGGDRDDDDDLVARLKKKTLKKGAKRS